ncbi:MAG: MraZ N-terminal domain-containing protein, partial [Planctomycetota bacterium]|nr:MraZ N-terminal domain-containing protein [Planctomycetota bacterium]
MKFFGEFKGQLIDPKGRLTIPKSLRAGLNEPAGEPQIFLQTYDTGILWIFTQSKLQSDVEQIDAAKDTHLELENY